MARHRKDTAREPTRKLRVLLVEPDYRRSGSSKIKTPAGKMKAKRSDDTLWYPPLGLMKLAEFHRARGDEVHFVYGNDKSVLPPSDTFDSKHLWDRVYITTLFTFHFDKIVKTVNFYKEAVGGTASKIFVGGIMASLMPKELAAETQVKPTTGLITSARILDLADDCNVDALTPDYSILDPDLYAINETYYAYTSRGCVNKCQWCGVPKIEPHFLDYIDIKPLITELRKRYGDKPRLKLMDNNVLASKALEQIVEDLVELGYGRGSFTNTTPPKQRIVDFNQGVDASYINDKNIRLISRLNIKPLRIAFDRIQERKQYTSSVKRALKHGFESFSNYMLFNFSDTPKDLYERLAINISLNEGLIKGKGKRMSGKIYSYPMRFAPIIPSTDGAEHRSRDHIAPAAAKRINWLTNPRWTKKFVRNVEIMKGAAHGSISPTPTLARRTIGKDFQEFVLNLYMPEELLRNRNKHEAKVYTHEPQRKKGTGKVEAFRTFMLKLLKAKDGRFFFFHDAVSQNSVIAIRQAIDDAKDKELKKWLKMYLIK